MAYSELEKQTALEHFLKVKKRIREDLVKLPFEEKIRRVIEMQKLARELKKDSKKKVYVWTL